MSITLSLVVLISSDFVLPKFVKGPDYFSAKVLISTLVTLCKK
jgi:hypothetical protein